MFRKYLGVYIYRNSEPGYALPWTARLDSGEQLAADTLAGIKELIKEKAPAKLTRKDIDQAMAAIGQNKIVVNGKVFYE